MARRARLNWGQTKLPHTELDKASESCKVGIDPAGFVVRYIDDNIGHGVFATKSMKKNDYILEYQGELISYKEGTPREKAYSESSAASFLFFLDTRRRKCDATNEKFSIGRMVKKGVGAMANVRMSIIALNGRPHLCMFAVRDISPGEEIQYNYDVPGLPWRKFEQAKDTQSGAEGHAKDLSAVDGLVSTVTEDATENENVSFNDIDENDVQASSMTELTESDRTDFEADVEDPNDHDFSPHESDVFSQSDKMSENEYSALQVPHSQQFLSLQAEEHVSGSDSCASNFIPMEADLRSLQMSEQHDQMRINKINDMSLIASSSKPTSASTKEGQKSLNVMKSKKHCGKRIWDKRHSCVFCGKLYPKLARHFEQKHKNELDVSKALSLPKKSTARKAIWRELLNRGDYHYNRQVLNEGTGTLIPYKRPSTEADATNYIPCEHCFGFFLKADLWRHVKNCTQRAKSSPDESKSRNHRHQAASALLLPVSSEAQENFKASILSSMANDTISFIARMDDTIVNFGEKMFAKCAKQPHQFQYVKQKMRELARFLLVARNTNTGIISLKDCINPPVFKDVIKAVRETCKFDGMDGTYGVPSLALKLGHSLKKCAGLLKSRAIQAEDPVMKQKALDFIELYTTEWNSEISTFALQTLHSSSFNRPKRIPLAEDVKKLNQHLETKAFLLHQSLEESPDPTIWRELVEVVLAQIVLFNRRRGGETERMEVSQYVEGINSRKPMQEEVMLSLTPFEQKLARQLGRVEIRGKRGRRVSVILTQNHRKRIDCLNRCRNTVGVSEENKYVFARIGNALTPIRSSDVLRKYAGECNASQPELLTSTSLRKHIATISQILNLKENELDSLASFLGHDMRIHRQYYRLPEDTIQVAKVSKILLELESGNIQAYRGKSLDEIQIDNDDVIEDLQDDCSGEEEEVEEEKAEFCEGKSCKSIVKAEKKKTTRVPWSKEEKAAVERQLGQFLRRASLPGKAACEEAKRKEPILARRPWTQIKFFIKNSKYKPSMLKL